MIRNFAVLLFAGTVAGCSSSTPATHAPPLVTIEPIGKIAPQALIDRESDKIARLRSRVSSYRAVVGDQLRLGSSSVAWAIAQDESLMHSSEAEINYGRAMLARHLADVPDTDSALMTIARYEAKMIADFHERRRYFVASTSAANGITYTHPQLDAMCARETKLKSSVPAWYPTMPYAQSYAAAFFAFAQPIGAQQGRQECGRLRLTNVIPKKEAAVDQYRALRSARKHLGYPIDEASLTGIADPTELVKYASTYEAMLGADREAKTRCKNGNCTALYGELVGVDRDRLATIGAWQKLQASKLTKVARSIHA